MVSYLEDIKCLNNLGSYSDCISDNNCYFNGLYCYPKSDPAYIKCTNHGTDSVSCENDDCRSINMGTYNICIPSQSNLTEYNRCVFNGTATCIEEGCNIITLDDNSKMCVPIKTLQTIPPTNEPTYAPTYQPTNGPTYAPTYQPTNEPTYAPTYQPTNGPTYQPTNRPTNPTKPVTTIKTDMERDLKLGLGIGLPLFVVLLLLLILILYKKGIIIL